MQPPARSGVEYGSPPHPAGSPPGRTHAPVPCGTRPDGQPLLDTLSACACSVAVAAAAALAASAARPPRRLPSLRPALHVASRLWAYLNT
jgi:hypothetical protein